MHDFEEYIRKYRRQTLYYKFSAWVAKIMGRPAPSPPVFQGNISDFDQEKLNYIAKNLTLYDISFYGANLDYNVLHSQKELRQLAIYGANMEDTRLLLQFPALERLKLNQGPAKHLECVIQLSNLQELVLNNHQLKDLDFLSTMTSLEVLDLSHNEIEDLAPLAKLKRLRVLRLVGNNLTDISPLAALTGLRSLDLSRNKLVDVSDLQVLGSLRWLSLARNGRLSSLHFLAQLVDLQELYLDYANANEGKLTLPPNLQTLSIANNHFAALPDLPPSLKKLNCSHNYILDLTPLAQLKGYNVLEINSNVITIAPPLSIYPCTCYDPIDMDFPAELPPDAQKLWALFRNKEADLAEQLARAVGWPEHWIEAYRELREYVVLWDQLR